MNLTGNFTGPLLVLALFVATTGTLRFAQDFFPPAGARGAAELFAFAARPAAGTLAARTRGRGAGDGALAFVLMGGLTYSVTSQILDLAGSVPTYRSNLIARVAALKTHENNPLRLAVQTITGDGRAE